jgi:hypothetical protein
MRVANSPAEYAALHRVNQGARAMRYRVNLHFDGAPRLSVECHPSGVTWMALHDSAHAQETDAQYVAIFAQVVPGEGLNRAVQAFNSAIDAAFPGITRREPSEAAE